MSEHRFIYIPDHVYHMMLSQSCPQFPRALTGEFYQPESLRPKQSDDQKPQQMKVSIQ